MVKYDVYKLASSPPFYLDANEIKSVDLMLEKAFPIISTCLLGRVYCNYVPVAGATVMVLDENFNPKYFTKANCYGGYVFKDIIPPGTYWVLAGAQGCKASKAKRLAVKQDVISKVNFNLWANVSTKKASIYGVVRDSFSQKPLCNVRVKVIKKNSKKLCAAAYTNKSGQYILYNINPGTYIIKAYHNDYLDYCSHKICIKICRPYKHNIYFVNIVD